MSFDALKLENLLDLNELIKIRALKDRRIEYTGSDEYTIKIFALKKLIALTPQNRTLAEIAAYYLKNIILLQAFPDGNHRTALTAIEMFLEMNGYSLEYAATEANQFRKELFRGRFSEYETYEERPTSVLQESDNQVFHLCLDFVKAHTRKTI